MILTTKNLQIIFTSIILLVGWGGWFGLKSIYPEMSMAWYPAIPVIFYGMGMILTSVLEHTNKDNPRKMVNIYMMLKLSKIIIAMTMIIVFYFLMKDSIRIILFTFLGYYALYLILESYAFYNTERKIKKTNEKIS